MEEVTKEKLLENKKIWYNRAFVLFEVVKSLRDRELSFIAKKEDKGIRMARYFMAHSIGYLDKHFQAVEFSRSLANMYQSVATLKNIPIFTYNFRERSKTESYKDFNKNYENHVTGYDLFLDFDGKENFEKCYEETKEMKAVFEEYKVPYWIMNSSSNGFHFHIPSIYMPKDKIENTLVKLNNVMLNLKAIYDFECLDETVVDMKRICKVPYSFVRDGTVCLPLDDTQLNLFTKKRVEAIEVLRTVKLKDRGLLLRTYNLSEKELKNNTKKFLEEFQ